MTPSANKSIYPCPFSKGYGIPRQQAWLLLTVFTLYRFIISCLFVILFFSRFGPALLGGYDPQLYIYTSLGYLLTSFVFAGSIYYRKPGYSIQAQIIIFIDIGVITMLMHACGGITSGIGILLVVTTAAGGLLIGGRCAMVFAALASLAILTEQVYSDLTHAFATTAYTYAGMLGASFFTIALLSYFLARRTEQSEQIITLREITIQQLEELNRDIIQHLNTGIIICEKNQKITLFNEAVINLLSLNQKPEDLFQISAQLANSFLNWQADTNKDITTFKLSPEIEIHLRFILLETEYKVYFMITLEDFALYNQRLQQGKLASLGQLTASIAHEIRNPLSAISHAGQLLSESPGLSAQNQRLTEIIQTHTLRVNKIIEDILQLSRRQPSKRKKIRLGQWLEQYLEGFIETNNLDKNFFIVEIEENNSIYIDPDHLKQILDNLCHNALLHGRQEDGYIIFKLSRDPQSLCLDVIDNGPGVDPTIVDRLFEPFFTTSASGNGLGLYISRELAELNQANLSYHTLNIGGSCFRLRLTEVDKKAIEI